MDLIYISDKVRQQCNNLKDAKKLFGGDEKLAISLLSRINAIEAAECVKDIIVQPHFHFHDLHNKGNSKLEGYFAIDVKTRKDPWRIILRPLNSAKEPYEKCNIDEISEIVEIKEVSKHYE